MVNGLCVYQHFKQQLGVQGCFCCLLQKNPFLYCSRNLFQRNYLVGLLLVRIYIYIYIQCVYVCIYLCIYGSISIDPYVHKYIYTIFIKQRYKVYLHILQYGNKVMRNGKCQMENLKYLWKTSLLFLYRLKIFILNFPMKIFCDKMTRN